MRDVFLRLGTDFFSSILFAAIYFLTDNIALATGVGIAGAVFQAIRARITGKELGFMTWASLGLVIVLGTATLKPGWMLRYMPPVVAETIPEYVTIAGFSWAALMFALGLGTIAVAMTGDMKLWAIYVSFVAVGAKIAAFAIQYVTFRLLIISRRRARAAAGA